MKAKVTRSTVGKTELFECKEIDDNNQIISHGKTVTAIDTTGKAKKDSIVDVTLTPGKPAYGKITSIL